MSERSTLVHRRQTLGLGTVWFMVYSLYFVLSLSVTVTGASSARLTPFLTFRVYQNDENTLLEVLYRYGTRYRYWYWYAVYSMYDMKDMDMDRSNI